MEWTEEKFHKLYQKLEEGVIGQIAACFDNLHSNSQWHLLDALRRQNAVDGWEKYLEAFGIQSVRMSKSLIRKSYDQKGLRISQGWLEGNYVIIHSPAVGWLGEHHNILKVPKDIAERILILGM